MKLLLTAAGTGTGFGYGLAAAKNFSQIHLITADTNPAELATTSLFGDRHIQFKPFEIDGYLGYINSALAEENIDFYLPLIDSEILFAADNTDSLHSRPAVNSREFCRAALTKSLHSEIAQGDGIKSPSQITKADFFRLTRAVAKQDGKFGGHGTIIKFGSEVRLPEGGGWHYYEYIEGEEFTVDCFPVAETASPSVVTSIRKRIETKAGVCTKAEIIEDSRLHSFALSLVEQFSLIHPFCFQTRFDGKHHYVIDINPRLGAGSAMSATNGTDFFSAHLALLCGGDPMPYLQRFYRRCVVTRQYSEYLMAAEPYEDWS